MSVQQDSMLASQSTTNVVRASRNNLPTNRNHQTFKVLVIAALLFLLGSGFAFGQTYSSDYTISGDYTTVNPLVVQNGATLTITGNLTASGGSIDIKSGSKLIVEGSVSSNIDITISPDAQLIVYTNVNVHGGNIVSHGDIIVLGDFNMTSSSGTLKNNANMVVGGDFTFGNGSFSTHDNQQVYLLGNNNSYPVYMDGTFDNSGNITDLQINNPDLYNQYLTLSGAAACSAFTLTASATPTSVWSNEQVQLNASASPSTVTLLDEGFNSATNNWTTTNNSGGSNPSDAAWTLRSDNYDYASMIFHSNDNSQFYLTNSDANGHNQTLTYLQSPSFSTQGLSSLTLEFYQYFKYYSPGYSETGKVEVSTDGVNWSTAETYNYDIGGSENFEQEDISLNAYVGYPTVYIRFKYDADYDWLWAIDNVKVTGTPAVQYSWTSNPAGFTSSAQNPTDNPAQTTTYTVTATDLFNSCSKSASTTVDVTVDNEAPVFPNFPNDTTVTADPDCTAKVWYNIPVATDNSGAYAGPLTGFSYLGDYNGHSYYLSTDLQLSVDAHTTVFDNGGHLATITSSGENNFLTTFAENLGQDVWFGLTDAAQEGTFRWVTGEYYSATDPASYKNWNPGEPNNTNNNENWAEMYATTTGQHVAGSWNDQFDTDSRYFFLEFDGPRVIGEMQNEGDPTWYPAPAPGSAFTTGIHHMRFTATDASGNTTVRTFDIIVNSGLNLAFSNPEQRVCANETGVTYTLNQPLDSYIWNVTGGTISAGGGTNDNYVTVDWGTGPDGKVTVTGANTGGCSETVSTNVHIIQPVAYTPSPDTTICNGATAHLRVTLPLDSAMQFDGSSHISIPNDNSINLQAVSNRTVSLWFKADNVGSRQVLYEEGGGVNGFSIYIENGKIYVHAWESNSTWTPTGSEIKKSINSNTWYDVAFVYDGNASDGIYFKGYLDGEYIGGISDAVAAGDMNAHSGDINIGTSSNIRYPDNSTDGGNNFTGEIDEFKLWNSSLTESEIFSEQYNNTFTSNEIVHYTFNNDNGTTVVDETGGNDGTLNGTVHTTDAPFRPTVSWSPGGGIGTTNDVSPTANTPYTYTLKEPLLGCTTSGSIAVTVNKVSLSASVTDETCTGSGNGAINLTPSGGVTPYSYVWSTADGSGLNGSSEDQTGLAPGTYDVVVTDANGCSATGSYTVATVPDVTNPTVTAPSDINQVADNGVCTAAVSVPNPTYSDNCSVASLLWEMTGATVDNSAGSGINSVGTYTFNKGTTTIIWTVTDAAGNSAQASMNVTVTDDQNPTITAPTDVSVSADAGSCLATSVALGSPTTSDNCGVASVTNDAPATFPKGTTVVTWTVTDNSGNTATATQNVTVTDTEKPVISDLSDLSTSVCASDETASPQYEVVNGIGLPASRITDNCSSTFTITYTISGATTVTNGTGDASGTTFYEGTSTVTYYATDESGNISAGKSFTVTVDHKPNPGNVTTN